MDVNETVVNVSGTEFKVFFLATEAEALCATYYPQAIRSYPGLIANLEEKGQTQLAKSLRTKLAGIANGYRAKASKYAKGLVAAVQDQAFDAVLRAPTSRPILVDPIFEEIRQALPAIPAGVLEKSTDCPKAALKEVTPSDLRHHFKLRWLAAPPPKPPSSVLLIDDIVATGKTLKAVYEFLSGDTVPAVSLTALSILHVAPPALSDLPSNQDQGS